MLLKMPSQDGADFLIVGGGPAGCSAAVTAASLGLRSILVEEENLLGGQVRSVASVSNFPGSRSPGDKFSDLWEDHINVTRHCIRVRAKVIGLEHRSNRWTIETKDGRAFTGMAVLAATGARPMRLDDPQGYLDHPDASCSSRLFVAGDVAHAAFQRIAVAIGDGASAALEFFYKREHLYGR